LVYKPDGSLSWGYQVPFEDKDRFSWFKLLLLRDGDLPKEIKESEPLLRARQLLEKLGKTPVEVIADYLRKLWEHALEIIAQARSPTLVGALKFHVVLTVPASWKDYARRAMKDAAKRAGIISDRSAGETVLSFAMEPEAAALATIWEKERHLKSDDTYMICE
jgi:molecular chaperone DnaK (HSP70)